MSDSKLAKLQSAASKLGIGGLKRHVFLCLGPDCCAMKYGEATWSALKKALRDHQLGDGPAACFRTKVGCLRVCTQGPILVVYPEGTWYANMTADRVDRFVREHLVEGRPVREWVFAENPLPTPAGPGESGA